MSNAAIHHTYPPMPGQIAAPLTRKIHIYGADTWHAALLASSKTPLIVTCGKTLEKPKNAKKNHGKTIPPHFPPHFPPHPVPCKKWDKPPQKALFCQKIPPHFWPKNTVNTAQTRGGGIFRCTGPINILARERKPGFRHTCFSCGRTCVGALLFCIPKTKPRVMLGN